MDNFQNERAVRAAYNEGFRDGVAEEKSNQLLLQEERDKKTYQRFVDQIEGQYKTRLFNTEGDTE